MPTRNLVPRVDSHTRARQVYFGTRLPYIKDKRCCSDPASFSGKGMSRWPFLLKHLSYNPVNPFDTRGVITFYELPVSSLMRVPGARHTLLGTFLSKDLDGFRLPGEGWRKAA